MGGPGPGALLPEVRGNTRLGRVVGAYAAFGIGEFGIWIVLLLYGYARDGASGALLMVLVQLVPGMLFSPYGGSLVDRLAPERVLRASYVAQALALGAMAATIALSGPAPVVYVLAPCATLGLSLVRPAQAALFPAIVRTPGELTAANVLIGWSDGAAGLAGPLLAGVAVALGGLLPAVIVAAGAQAVAAALVWGRIGSSEPDGIAGPHTDVTGVADVTGVTGVADVTGVAGTSGTVTGGSLRPAAVVANMRATLASPATRLLLVLFAFFYMLVGALDMLCVVLAVSVLHAGQGAAGYLNAAVGGGATVAGVVTVALAGRPRLARLLAVSLLVAVGALALVGGFPSAASAAVLLGVVGLSGMVFLTVARTLFQRVAPPGATGTTFAAAEAITDFGLATGALVVRAAIAIGGPRAALFAPAVVGVLLVAACWRRLRAVDAAATVPQVQIRLLRTIPIFAPLRAPALEAVARRLELVPVPAGTAVVREGEAGDTYYAVADGTLAVTRAGRPLRTLERGSGFGEIALLTHASRTATVTATTDAVLYGLDHDAFVGALTGSVHAGSAARRVVASYGDADVGELGTLDASGWEGSLAPDPQAGPQQPHGPLERPPPPAG